MNEDQSSQRESESSQKTVGDLVDELQAQGLLGDEAMTAEAARQLETSFANQARADAERRAEIERVVSVIGPSPPSIQVKFLKGIAQNPAEASAFTDDPRGYSKAHGVLLDPALVRGISDHVLYGEQLPIDIVKNLGRDGIRDLVDIRVGPGGVAAWPAAVAAVAAVVSAAAAVVTAVTAVTSDHARDILALKGLGPHGVRLPAGLGNPSGQPNPLGPDGPTNNPSGPIGPPGPGGPGGPTFFGGSGGG